MAVRWGHLREIRHVRRVRSPGSKRLSPVFARLPARLKHLSAWRRMHMLPGGKNAHAAVRAYARGRGQATPSSNLSLTKKLQYIRFKEKT